MRNEAQADNKDLTFKPRVPDATRKIVAGRTSAAATGKRTVKQEAADKARESRLARAAEVKRQEQEALPFKPELPSRSEELAASNPAFKGKQGADFLKRSQLFERRRAEQAATASEEVREHSAGRREIVIPHAQPLEGCLLLLHGAGGKRGSDHATVSACDSHAIYETGRITGRTEGRDSHRQAGATRVWRRAAPRRGENSGRVLTIMSSMEA
eukprot:COSAG02_NODE_13338_length_1407_cov_1.924312_1_plen_213_part_00